MMHYIDSIRRAGSPFEYIANMYEHLHIMLIKQAYQGRNCRDYMGHIAKHNLWLQTLRKVARNIEGFEAPLEWVTILDKVNSQMSTKCFIYYPKCSYMDMNVHLDVVQWSNDSKLYHVLQGVECGFNILSSVAVNLRTTWLKDIDMLDAEANNKYHFPKSVYSILSFYGGIIEEFLKAFKVYKVDNNLGGGEVQCSTTL
jgi:hypothetical protein